MAAIIHSSLAPRHVTIHIRRQPSLNQSESDDVAPIDTRGTTARSHTFQLPAGAAYDVKWMSGHMHIGGRNIQARPEHVLTASSTVVYRYRGQGESLVPPHTRGRVSISTPHSVPMLAASSSAQLGWPFRIPSDSLEFLRIPAHMEFGRANPGAQ